MKISAFLLLAFIISSLNAQNALHFDGVDDFVAAGNPGPIGTADRTVELWIKTNNSISTQQVLVDWGDMAIGNRFTLNLINFGRVRLEIGGNGFNSNTTVADGNWHHIAVTYDQSASTKAIIYIDGALDNSHNFTVSMNTSNVNGVILGRRNDGVNYYEGLMDDVRIWDYARTAQEINREKDQEFCSANTGLLYYYNMNQGVAGSNNSSISFVYDRVSANDGALIGFSLMGNNSNWVSGKVLNKAIVNSISRNSFALIADDTTARYQWFNCNGLTFQAADTNRIFTPAVNGQYGLALSKGYCVDTSSCVPVISVGVTENESIAKYSISQKPGKIQVLNKESMMSSYRLLDLKGSHLYELKNSQAKEVEITYNIENPGIYLLQIKHKHGTKVVKLWLD